MQRSRTSAYSPLSVYPHCLRLEPTSELTQTLAQGQRLSVLKAVYKLKLRDDVPFEEGHWMPPSARNPVFHVNQILLMRVVVADGVDDAPIEFNASRLSHGKMSALLGQRGQLFIWL